MSGRISFFTCSEVVLGWRDGVIDGMLEEEDDADAEDQGCAE